MVTMEFILTNAQETYKIILNKALNTSQIRFN